MIVSTLRGTLKLIWWMIDDYGLHLHAHSEHSLRYYLKYNFRGT